MYYHRYLFKTAKAKINIFYYFYSDLCLIVCCIDLLTSFVLAVSVMLFFV